jgi:hypothetical protein
MAEEKEKEKSFTVKDRRHFTTEGEARQDEKREEPPAPAAGEGPADESRQSMPEIDFSSFVFSLSTSALLHFGEITDPVSNSKERNLPLAKQTIDLLGMLQEKTRGNLTVDEEHLLANILYNLRMKYVEEVKKG